MKSSQFAIAPSREVDINLIDEPKEAFQIKEQAKPVVKNSIVPEKVIPKIQKPVFKTIEKPKQLATPSAQVKVEAKPDYIQNPPPPYPELAKQMRQEGVVMLSVNVDRMGEAVKVEITQSSGFRLLDQAALKAVRQWKFQPGSIGGIAVNQQSLFPSGFD